MTTRLEANQDRLLKDLTKTGDKISRLRAEANALEHDKLLPLIREADEANLSLRVIGGAAGISHVTVMRMLDR